MVQVGTFLGIWESTSSMLLDEFDGLVTLPKSLFHVFNDAFDDPAFPAEDHPSFALEQIYCTPRVYGHPDVSTRYCWLQRFDNLDFGLHELLLHTCKQLQVFNAYSPPRSYVVSFPRLGNQLLRVLAAEEHYDGLLLDLVNDNVAPTDLPHSYPIVKRLYQTISQGPVDLKQLLSLLTSLQDDLLTAQTSGQTPSQTPGQTPGHTSGHIPGQIGPGSAEDSDNNKGQLICQILEEIRALALTINAIVRMETTDTTEHKHGHVSPQQIRSCECLVGRDATSLDPCVDDRVIRSFELRAANTTINTTINIGRKEESRRDGSQEEDGARKERGSRREDESRKEDESQEEDGSRKEGGSRKEDVCRKEGECHRVGDYLADGGDEEFSAGGPCPGVGVKFMLFGALPPSIVPDRWLLWFQLPVELGLTVSPLLGVGGVHVASALVDRGSQAPVADRDGSWTRQDSRASLLFYVEIDVEFFSKVVNHHEIHSSLMLAQLCSPHVLVVFQRWGVSHDCRELTSALQALGFATELRLRPVLNFEVLKREVFRRSLGVSFIIYVRQNRSHGRPHTQGGSTQGSQLSYKVDVVGMPGGMFTHSTQYRSQSEVIAFVLGHSSRTKSLLKSSILKRASHRHTLS
ncbi:hypothetical protein GNI_010230 [Gregarina niphandrodes]|uniref:Uncharacterized protein n=1 Tax=Gregarina niphandrodes TaxID=110365 RepID=A0A023BCY1_GRENI|nr:hypothetical protein GNI_010230 [Gregarina niphandrodes]EZG86499.1 hypothetical protein GNI_010230 [Gregarina niphandrodes]|eukprot:XP_011128756.1 hypothetical protein GNI_010230 [Gregarina niphandrodes]